jgi:uncharacterized SAM-binding protein YcdF (DUF218 family)
MSKKTRILAVLLALIACGVFLYGGCAWNAEPAPSPEPSPTPETTSAAEAEPAEPTASPEPEHAEQPETTAGAEASPTGKQGTRSDLEIIREMIFCYNGNGNAGEARILELLSELAAQNPDLAGRWERIMDLWRSGEKDLVIREDVLPDGLPDTDELCIVALGFQLAPDGSMREELVERLKVVLASARKYPNALVVCTGGGTAAENETATEAGKMAEWLIENGVAPERVIAEEQSLTTAQNAVYTFDLLEKRCPQVRQLAIVSSDYHIATGTLLFEAEAILRAEKAGAEAVQVVSNAAWKAPSGSLSTMFQAGALIELSGDVETAFDIYYDNYDIHDFPPKSFTCQASGANGAGTLIITTHDIEDYQIAA